MKKNLIAGFIVVSVAIVIFWLRKGSHQNLIRTIQTNGVVMSNVSTSLPSFQNLPSSKIAQQIDELASTNKPAAETILVDYQTLDDLKQIKSLHEINGFLHERNWYSNSNLVAFQLKSVKGKPIKFMADMMWALTDKKDGHVRQLDLHSPEMDIDQIRQVGLQLEEAWGLDPTDFLTWCNKVGNKWLDAPLYSSRNGTPPSSNKLIGFGVHRNLSDDKPWYIILSIQDGP